MKTNAFCKYVQFCLLLLVIALAQFAAGQNANTGEVRGFVMDSSNAAVVGARVAITNTATGTTIVSETNNNGLYDVPSVPSGPYRIIFSKAGFRDFVRDGITVQLQTISVNATLQVGAAAEQVTVVGETPLLQTETSDQQVNLDNKAVLDAPVVGGIWYTELTKVLPGVGGGSASGGESVAVNGTQSFSANFQIDGTSATDPRDINASDNYPPVDAIDEVSISTANAPPQNGNSLLTLNVNLKSGTNRWHGSLFEFNQNDFFESRNYFNNGKKAPVRWNEFGGSIGGPIVKNKLFFNFTYQRNPVSQGNFYKTTVPTDAMRSGDFSSPLFKATIYDKNSCAGTCARTPLNGGSNIILPSQIDPVAAAILKFIPVATDKTATTNNFSSIVSTPSLGEWYVGKVDYQIAPNHRLSGSIFEYPITLTFNPDALCGLGFDCTTSTPNNRNQSARITETWTINPRAVNEARIGGMREHDHYQPATFGKGFPTKIGMQPTYGSNSPIDVFPNITVTGNASGVTAQTFIGGGVHADLVENVYTASDVLTLVRGRHTIKLGGELDRQFQRDTTWGDSSSGDFQFNGIGTKSGTSLDPRAGGATSPGIPFADFLLGDVGTWSIFNGDPTRIATWITGAFVNDDFKVTQRLTVNVGLRYQHQTGWAVANNTFGTFDPTLSNPGSFPPGALGAIRYGGLHGSNTIEPGVDSLSPRIGFAWSPMDKWSIRASYGIFQTPRGSENYAHDNFPATLGLGFNPHGFIGNGTNVAFQLQTGPPPNSVTFPTLATLTPDQFNFQVVSSYPTSLPLQYTQQFYFNVQRELPANHLVEVSYVHTKGTHLNFATDVNQVPQAQLTNPANTGDFSPLRPYKQFRSILAHNFTGWSNYDSLQLRVIKRFSTGLSYELNYAWSKLLDTGSGSGHSGGVDLWQIANNPRANYGLSTYDATHNFTGSISYDLPFGEGRMFPAHGVMNQIIGGWRITTILQARSGVPFTPIVASGSADLALAGSINCFCGYSLFANRIGSGSVSDPTITKWFDPTAFTDPTFNGTSHGAIHVFGNAGRNILRGPSYVNTDLSMGKTFPLRESMSFEIRADAFNAFNHPQFSLPDNNILSTTAGQITSTISSGAGRIIQMGGRFKF